jgi:hypothetical protein
MCKPGRLFHFDSLLMGSPIRGGPIPGRVTDSLTPDGLEPRQLCGRAPANAGFPNLP